MVPPLRLPGYSNDGFALGWDARCSHYRNIENALIRGSRPRRLQHFLHLEIHGVAPAKADLVALVTGAYLDGGVSRDYVELLADGAVLGKARVLQSQPNR